MKSSFLDKKSNTKKKLLDKKKQYQVKLHVERTKYFLFPRPLNCFDNFS